MLRGRSLTTVRVLAVAAAVAVLAALAAMTGTAHAGPPTVTAAFPRVAHWWPAIPSNEYDDELQTISASDWVCLQNYNLRHVPRLRELNPDIYLLGTTSARELNYRITDADHPDRAANWAYNQQIRDVPTEWILTQLGTTLSVAIDGGVTTIPVQSTEDRFYEHELVLCDQELMWVTSVAPDSITVLRGEVNQATSHPAGARIAAVVSVWPGSITYDLSTNCPRVMVDGVEKTWANWNTQRGIDVSRMTVTDGNGATWGWDGVFIDCLESNASWMVTSNRPCGQYRVRSVDPNRSNTPVSDGYAAFNDAWNDGAVAYGDALKAGEPAKAFIGNGNIRNYRMNGNVFEQFPYHTLTPFNWNLVFRGPWEYPHASYPEWCASAAAPNLTMVQTYGGETDYKLMRWGLCSTLLSDGFFSYSGDNHSRAGYWRYDEFDNAGEGRGYLGKATGGAYSPASGVWRRNYENGVVLVNGGASAQSAALGGVYRRIDGLQDPVVNSGDAVSTVSLQPGDGIVVLTAGRVSGPDRYSNAAAISRAHFDSASTVVIASGDEGKYCDALAAGGLAGSVNGPLLLTPGTGLSSYSRVEIQRLGASSVFVVGGPDTIPGGILSAIDAIPGVDSVTRVWGEDRYLTAAEVARRIKAIRGADFEPTCFIVKGSDFPDALSCSTYAAARCLPILLVKPPPATALPGATRNALTELGISKVVIAGSEASVAPEVMQEIGRVIGDAAAVSRVDGPDRYAVSRRLAERALAEGWATPHYTVVVSGEVFPDGLAGGPAVGREGGVILLTDGSALSASPRTFLEAHQREVHLCRVFGGTPTVSSNVIFGSSGINWVLSR